jgi:hypothetical protein
MTLEVWLQLDAAQPGGGFVGGQTIGGGGAWVLGGGIGQPQDGVLSVSTPATDAVFAPGALVPGPTWKHFAGTFDGAVMRIYVDGAFVAQKNHPSPGPSSDVVQLILGRFPVNGATLFFAGTLDELRLWNVVRSAADIQADYATELTGSEAGLVGYYKFDEAGGDDILDSSTRGNDGFLGATLGSGPDDPTRVASGAPVGGGVIGSTYCDPAVANSTGAPGVITATGSVLVADNDVTLTATDLPQNQFGYFLNSQTQGFVPMPSGSQGNLCVVGQVGRHVAQLASTGAAGELQIAVDLTALPTPSGPAAVLVGQTYNFQCWYRDLNPNTTSNFTNAVEVLFL